MNEQQRDTKGHGGRSHSFGQGNWSGGSYDSAGRVPVSLACSECKTRNYKTTKTASAGALELKKFCKQCKKHTVHRETK